ncbi:Rv1733c family protein [Streptomyces sp. NPDC001739]
MWWWRFRRSPLRRTSDLVEAWLLLVAWVLGVVGGAAGGLVTAVMAERSFEEERSGRRQVVAVLMGNAMDTVTTRTGDGNRAKAEVRWEAPDGRTRTGWTSVIPHASAGTRMPLWTNHQGDLVSQPPDGSDAMLWAGVAGVGATAVAGGVVWAGTRALRALLQRHRLKQWAVEWARADTRWGGRTG